MHSRWVQFTLRLGPDMRCGGYYMDYMKRTRQDTMARGSCELPSQLVHTYEHGRHRHPGIFAVGMLKGCTFLDAKTITHSISSLWLHELQVPEPSLVADTTHGRTHIMPAEKRTQDPRILYDGLAFLFRCAP